MLVVVPKLALGTDYEVAVKQQQSLLQSLLDLAGARERLFWYYTPMALAFSSELPRDVTVYDKMDELVAFFGAPPQLRALEKAPRQGRCVFAGGASLYETTQGCREDVHLFPSSVDMVHFGRARELRKLIGNREARPLTMGFFGVIDERMDVGLLSPLRNCVRIGRLTL